MGKQKFFRTKQKIIYIILIIVLFTGCNNNSDELNSKLYTAIEIGNLEAVKEVITDWKSEGYSVKDLKLKKRERVWDMSTVDSPLVAAMWNGRYDIVEYLAGQDVDFNCIGSNGKSLLMYSIENYVDSNFEIFIEKGADVNYVNKDGMSVLDIALDYGNINVIHTLLKSSDINVSDEVINRYINKLRGEEEYYKGYGILKELLRHNANGNTDIYNSIFNSDYILNGYNVENRDMIILCTAAFGNTNVLSNLISDYNYDIHKLFMLACEYGNIENVKYLLSIGADINSCDKNGVTAIERAMENNLGDTVRYLLQNGASTRGEKGTNYDDILCFAVYNNNYDITKLLIEEYNDNLNMDRALEAAARYGYDLSLKAFLDSGIKANCIVNGSTLLELACLSDDGDNCVNLLLKNGANVNGIDGSPLMNAVKFGNTEIVKKLINSNVDVNYNLNNNGEHISVLYYAAVKGYFDMVKDLVEYGATFNNKEEITKGLRYIKLSNNIYNYLLNNNLI